MQVKGIFSFLKKHTHTKSPQKITHLQDKTKKKNLKYQSFWIHREISFSHIHVHTYTCIQTYTHSYPTTVSSYNGGQWHSQTELNRRACEIHGVHIVALLKHYMLALSRETANSYKKKNPLYHTNHVRLLH